MFRRGRFGEGGVTYTSNVHVFHHQGSHLTYSRVGQGPPLVLIHGLSGSRLWWRRNTPSFQREFTVYTLDLVGFGSSRCQRPLPIRESAKLIGAWLDHLCLEAVRIVGHSMGAHTAIHIANGWHERVSSLVLVAASAMVHEPWWRIAMRLPQAGINGALDFLPTLAYDALRSGPLNLYRATQEILRDDVLESLTVLSLPTLLVWGERDVLVTLEQGQKLQQALTGARLEVIPGAGHNVMYDRAKAFNSLVLPFLRDGATT
jgi:pimeloyl-ACP methyl ester carboxylesterase